MKNFQLVSDFTGYSAKKDITNVDPRFLIVGSQNVLVNDGEKISSRYGYTLDGSTNSALTPITAAYDWNTSTGVERNTRAYEGELEYRYVDSAGTVTWRRLANGFGTATKFRFAEWWSSAEGKDLLLMVNGTNSIRMWSGGIAVLLSSTANTLTKTGTTTWGEERFLIAGTRQVVINGTTYTYTGGEGTTTLTGVTPSPAAEPTLSIVHQALVTSAATPASGFSNDLIAVNKNQVYVGDDARRDVYVSKNSSYTDYTFTANRLPGEGALLTLDSATVGFKVQEDAMYITAGKNDWYQVTFALSSDNTKEAMSILKLKSGTRGAAQSQELIGAIKNSIIFVSNEPTLDTLGRVEQINTPQSRPLSDPIKDDFQDYDFTNGDVKYFRNQTFIAVPVEGKVLIYDHENGYWQPPQIMGIRRFAIIGGELYGHSSSTPETYKIFDPAALTDNGNPINSVAVFAYRNFGKRAWKKRFDEYYNEGYLMGNTVLSVTYNYDFGGFSGVKNKDIDGSNTAILFNVSPDGSFGQNPLGHSPLGGVPEEVSDLTKFRDIHTFSKVAFYEYSVTYSSNEEGFFWQLLAQGPNTLSSTTDSVPIKT